MRYGKFLILSIIFIMMLTICVFSAEKTITKEDIISSFEPTITNEYNNSCSIRSFDVNENGDIIISVRENGNGLFEEMYGQGNYALYIYDSKMTLKYGIKIKSMDNSVGAIWKNGYPTAVIGFNDAFQISFDENGDIVSFENVKGNNNKAFEKERTINEKTYILTNNNKATAPVIISPAGEYKYLFLKDSNNITTLYENKTSRHSFDQYIPIIVIIGIIFISLIVGTVCIVWFVFVKKNIKHNKRTKM